jgi:predicted AAA+ superfamily ATPase
MIRLLAGITGQTLNLSNLSNEALISVPTIQKYLWLAEKTFFIRLITPFTANVTKEITKAPVVYFIDHGMRNFSISAFGNLQHPGDFGFAFQNMVCMILISELHGMPFRLHFWRTTDKAEVDFIISRYKDPIPVEVKFAALKKPSISRSLRSYLDKYKPREAWLVNLTLNTGIQVGGTVVRFIPYALLQEQIKEVIKSIETVYLAEEKSFPYRILRH